MLLALSVSARNWSGTAWLGAALVIYLAGVRRTRCRVETVTTLLAVASLVVAIMSFVRDLIAG